VGGLTFDASVPSERMTCLRTSSTGESYLLFNLYTAQVLKMTHELEASAVNSNEQIIARLNELFPDGESQYPSLGEWGIDSTIATTLSQHSKIQAKLQLQILDVKAEVQRLKAELKRDQDPAKMGRIQKQIGVCRS
jgi:hypothetical protein